MRDDDGDALEAAMRERDRDHVRAINKKLHRILKHTLPADQAVGEGDNMEGSVASAMALFRRSFVSRPVAAAAAAAAKTHASHPSPSKRTPGTSHDTSISDQTLDPTTSLQDISMQQAKIYSAMASVDHHQSLYPNCSSFTPFLAHYARHGSLYRTYAWWYRMLGYGVRPTQVAWNVLLGAHVRHGDWHGAMAIVAGMHQGQQVAHQGKLHQRQVGVDHQEVSSNRQTTHVVEEQEDEDESWYITDATRNILLHSIANTVSPQLVSPSSDHGTGTVTSADQGSSSSQQQTTHRSEPSAQISNRKQGSQDATDSPCGASTAKEPIVETSSHPPVDPRVEAIAKGHAGQQATLLDRIARPIHVTLSSTTKPTITPTQQNTRMTNVRAGGHEEALAMGTTLFARNARLHQAIKAMGASEEGTVTRPLRDLSKEWQRYFVHGTLAAAPHASTSTPAMWERVWREEVDLLDHLSTSRRTKGLTHQDTCDTSSEVIRIEHVVVSASDPMPTATEDRRYPTMTINHEGAIHQVTLPASGSSDEAEWLAMGKEEEGWLSGDFVMVDLPIFLKDATTPQSPRSLPTLFPKDPSSFPSPPWWYALATSARPNIVSYNMLLHHLALHAPLPAYLHAWQHMQRVAMTMYQDTMAWQSALMSIVQEDPSQTEAVTLLGPPLFRDKGRREQREGMPMTDSRRVALSFAPYRLAFTPSITTYMTLFRALLRHAFPPTSLTNHRPTKPHEPRRTPPVKVRSETGALVQAMIALLDLMHRHPYLPTPDEAMYGLVLVPLHRGIKYGTSCVEAGPTETHQTHEKRLSAQIYDVLRLFQRHTYRIRGGKRVLQLNRHRVRLIDRLLSNYFPKTTAKETEPAHSH